MTHCCQGFWSGDHCSDCPDLPENKQKKRAAAADEAADEIERLEEELHAAKAALGADGRANLERYLAAKREALRSHVQSQARASDMTDGSIESELADLDSKRKKLRDDLEKSGGHSGSPGEWIVERMDELETEQRRRRADPKEAP